MKHSLFVCLLVLTAVNVAPQAVAQSPPLQQGVSVNMAVTASAQPMPAADNQDAWIITVLADGRLFFGIHPVSPAELINQMKINPRRRDQNLYIKADAHAPFANVKQALQAARVGMFETPVLLTNQHQSAQPGTMVPPEGLEVLLSQPVAVEPIAIRIRSAEKEPSVEVNNRPVSWENLQANLAQLLQNQNAKVVLVQADDQLPFAAIARAIDISHSVGAKVVVPTPGS